MKKPFVITIGISAYNEEANIQKLLKSLTQQKELGFIVKEIIVISDGSTDSTVEKASSIHDRRIKVIVHSERKGQNNRQNELLDSMSSDSNAFLLLEADWLPANTNYILNLVKAIPKSGVFSMITGCGVPFPEKKLWGKIMNCGFYYRYEIYNNATKQSGLYQSFGGRLLSKRFIRTFRWKDEFHEDSYLFRKILEFGLPRISANTAKIYFKSVTSFSDYLLQSGKYQKARLKEKSQSNIYDVQFDFIKIILVTFRHFLNNPILLSLYILASLLSRFNSLFLPNYNIFWKPYSTSKSFNTEDIKYTNTVKDCFSNQAFIYNQSAIFKNKGRQHLSEIETNYIRQHLNQSKLHILDLGVGAGRNAEVLLSENNSVTGLDISAKMIELTKKNLSKYHKAQLLNLKTTDLNDSLPFKSNQFTGAICIRVIKYVKAWKKLLREVNRVLKNKSVFIVEVANKNSVQSFSQNYNLFFTFDEKVFEQELQNNGFIILNKTYGTKLPLYIYDLINSSSYIKFLSAMEKALAYLFGGNLSRNILYTCVKTKTI